ncbi:glycosyltransferase [Limnohabitans sp. Rim8]|uniref:glycosyltransferase n=1 Tax=Limnohabitans sp. Rim8 TaxID=1100718 RepID=UPI0025DFA9B1|nr:glycosyltransferase [Limnohabitans sp. Rim8]
MSHEVQLIYFNAGGGHRSAALALQEVIAQAHPDWAVSLVNLFEVIDSDRYYQKLTGFAPEDLYNLRLKRGWTRGLATELKLFQAMIRLTLPKLKKKMRGFWRNTQPDLVVSLVPNFNKVMYEALREELPGVPYVTVLTDMADYPPNFWIEPNQGQYIICGTEFAASQAVASGYDAESIIRTSGMILRPSFYSKRCLNKAERFAEIGLDPQRPTGLVLFGGHGSNDMLKIAKALPDQQLIFVAGHNTALARKMAVQSASPRHLVLGFTKDIDHYMQLSDYFVGKPGPGSLSEAVHMGLPVITFRNASTMPQERYNTTWVEEKKLGMVISAVSELPSAIHALLNDLPKFKQHVQDTNNQAVFEVVAALAKIRQPKPGQL